MTSYGLAIDCGTSGISLALSRNDQPETLACVEFENPCRRFGLDVITRAQTAHVNPAAKGTLVTELWQTIAREAEALCRQSEISLLSLSRICFAANPILTHLALGLDTEGMTVYPYTLPERFGREVDFSLRDYGFSPSCTLWVAPLTSAFIGGDVLLGFLATKNQELPRLFADLGTNGEMILQTDGALFAASAAAGPAFEGGFVRCGMPAKSGAICHVRYQDGAFSLSTVDGAAPRGLCAQGLMQLLIEAKKAGLISENGLVFDDCLCVSQGILLTTKEVRAVLLAKAAFFAAANALLRAADLTEKKPVRLILSGGIGEHLDPRTAEDFGLFDRRLCATLKTDEHAALAGALCALWDEDFQNRAIRTANDVTVLDLAADPVFQEEYILGIAL